MGRAVTLSSKRPYESPPLQNVGGVLLLVAIRLFWLKTPGSFITLELPGQRNPLSIFNQKCDKCCDADVSECVRVLGPALFCALRAYLISFFGTGDDSIAHHSSDWVVATVERFIYEGEGSTLGAPSGYPVVLTADDHPCYALDHTVKAVRGVRGTFERIARIYGVKNPVLPFQTPG